MKTKIINWAAVLTAVLCLTSSINACSQNVKKAEPATKAVVELNVESFNKTVYDMNAENLKFLGDKPAIVDFTAIWCGPCRKLAPALEELAVEYKGKVDVYKVDVDKAKTLVEAFNISSIPAVMFIPADGEPVMTIGFRDKETIRKQIETILLGK